MASTYPQWAYAAALASLPLQTYQRLRRLLDLGEPSAVWELVRTGERPLVKIDNEAWKAWTQAPESLLGETAEVCIESGITVVTHRDPAYPEVLHLDAHAPAVLFVKGNIECLRYRRVGIIGTRTPTQSGRYIARKLGAALASENVSVVSGLARGIDVAAHIGALTGKGHNPSSPVAVVASGLNKVYPPEHKDIWHRIGEEGLLISEAPPNARPEVYRFPLRNRILAGLSEVLVVVESRARGGSMITVREAMKRDITVMAVPGNTEVTSCEGTNILIREGCAPVLDVEDVLVALGLDNRRSGGGCDTREAPTAEERIILEALGGVPRSINEIALLSGQSVIDTAVLLGRLEAKEWTDHTDGWWEALLR